ncbi:hypothetical protein BDR22DRAFT_827002 [Usnea florida]
MDQGTLEDHLLLDWLQNYTCYICDRLNIPQDQGTGLLEGYLKLPARTSAEQSSASAYKQPASHLGTTNSHYETRHPQHLTKPGLATYTQDQAMIPHETYDRHDDASTGYNTNPQSNLMAPETSSSLLRPHSYPKIQRSDGLMPMNLGQSESSHQLSQPIQAVKDRAPLGSIEDYDPLWVQKGNVNPKIVEDFKSRISFDTLFSYSVVRPGDVLTVQVTVPNGGDVTYTEAHLRITGLSKSSAKRTQCPDFAITIPSQPPKQYPPLKACAATTPIFNHLKNHCNANVTKRSWCNIQVFRGQHDLGNLRWVTQAFNVWKDMKDREARRTGQIFRKRR